MRKSIRPQSRRHIWFYDDDWEFIDKFMAPRAGLSPGSYVRELTHRFVEQQREAQQLRVEAAQRASRPHQEGDPQ